MVVELETDSKQIQFMSGFTFGIPFCEVKQIRKITYLKMKLWQLYQ